MKSLSQQLAILCAGLVSTACGTNWTVIKAADPNPFVNHTTFQLEPLTFVDLQVDEKPESEHIAQLDAATRAAWDADKTNIASTFKTALLAQLHGAGISFEDSGTYTIRPTVKAIDTGYLRVIPSLAVSRIDLTLELINPNNRVVDEIRIVPGVRWRLLTPTVSGRLSTAAKKLGTWAADFLIERCER